MEIEPRLNFISNLKEYSKRVCGAKDIFCKREETFFGVVTYWQQKFHGEALPQTFVVIE